MNLILLFTLSILVASQAAPNSNKVCVTPECVHAAKTIKERMNRKIQPCDDFYEFTCGKFVHDPETIVGYFDDGPFTRILENEFQKQIQSSIKSEIKDDEPRAIKLLKTYYKTCSESTQTESSKDREFREILDEFGGWPIYFTEWEESQFDWSNFSQRLYNKGFDDSFFFSITIEDDKENPDRHAIYISKPSFGIPWEFLEIGWEDKNVQSYLNFSIYAARMLGANEDDAKIALNESLFYEIEFARLYGWQNWANTSTYNPYTIAELQTRWPIIPWTEYLNRFSASHASLKPGELIIVRDPEYLDWMSERIPTMPKRTQANFMLTQVLMSSIQTLSKTIQDSYYNVIVPNIEPERKSRPEECLEYAKEKFGVAVAALYARQFDSRVQADINDMVERIRTSFESLLIQNTWISDETKNAAVEKLRSIKAIVAHPNELLDDEIVNKEYEGLELDSESFLKNELQVRLFQQKMDIRRLWNPKVEFSWRNHTDLEVANANYFFEENIIYIRAGMVQGEFFGLGRPNYLNYAGIGSIIGHELSHAFDINTMIYDNERNLNTWYDAKTKNEYLRRTECLKEQYKNYTVEINGKPLHLNGTDTVGENFADTSGIKGAYYAYKNWAQKNGPEAYLPGLPYTPQQMFWINAASSSCDNISKDSLLSSITSDEHTINRFRVIGSMSNSLEFSRDFDCPVGSNMNPKSKCTFL